MPNFGAALNPIPVDAVDVCSAPKLPAAGFPKDGAPVTPVDGTPNGFAV